MYSSSETKAANPNNIFLKWLIEFKLEAKNACLAEYHCLYFYSSKLVRYCKEFQGFFRWKRLTSVDCMSAVFNIYIPAFDYTVIIK